MITILTPTYNRAYILPNAYESLRRQTNTAFEWIVVDDGSADETEALVTSWQEEKNLFPIYYVKQPNGGKHRAVNKGVSMAAGDYVLILDSDDYLTDDAVQTIYGWVKTIADVDGFAGVSGLKGWKNRSGAVGGAMMQDYVDATNLQRKKLGLMGDKAEVYKTALLRQYPFPEFEGENFLRETAVWDRIAIDGYQIRWFNKIIYLCDYLEDGLTRNANNDLYARNFQGYLYCSKIVIKAYDFPYNLLRIGQFYQVANTMGKKSKEVCTLLEISRFRLLMGRLVAKVKGLLRK